MTVVLTVNANHFSRPTKAAQFLCSLNSEEGTPFILAYLQTAPLALRAAIVAVRNYDDFLLFGALGQNL